MGVVNIEGKPISLDDAIIDAGIDAIKAVLAPDFPDIENADIQIERPARAGAPVTASVVKRGTHKGQTPSFEQRVVLEALERAPEYVNQAVRLAVEALRREAAGDTKFFDEALRRGDVERADEAGEREGRAVLKALETCSGCPPVASNHVPAGF
ncbi:MAG TPA: hypothetical protein VF723_11425 [Pyrinomonadaceae bacterium]|jgi:hypothetical protein